LAEGIEGHRVNDNLLLFFKNRPEVFPLRQDIDLQRLLLDAIDRPGDTLPAPAKIFLLDELAPHAYGFPLTKTPILDELESKLERWINDEIAARLDPAAAKSRADESLLTYRTLAVKIARNALHSSILADYHAVFWLVHSQQLAKLFTAVPRKVFAGYPAIARDQADIVKYALAGRWTVAMRDAASEIVARGTDGTRFTDSANTRFLELLLDNPLIITEDFISADLKELRSYFTGSVRRDFGSFRKMFDELRARGAELMTSDRLFRRAVTLLGYPETAPNFVTLLDRRVQQLIADHPSTRPLAEPHVLEGLSRRLLEYFIVYNLRRGIIWMTTTADGDNVSEEAPRKVYSRGIRPMNFGRRGIVEPIVYRFGLVYDITSFTQTLGEIARGGKGEEQSSYRQMLEFQRDLAEMTHRHALQFEKFLGDGAFYTSRRALRTIQAAVEVQQFYSLMKARGFAFNKGMRIALNYGYYRLLPMQVSSDGTEIKEFYGPGIVELSRLTSGKATKELEDIQHLLLSHGYDQNEVYRFFAPLSRSVGKAPAAASGAREFYAYVNESGHLINEGIVASIPFLKELTGELAEEQQRIYRLRTEWASYLGFPAASKEAGYIGIRILGSVSLKGIGNQDVAEIVRLTHEEAEISLVDDDRPLLALLEQERHRSTASLVSDDDSEAEARLADLVVCESHVPAGTDSVILVGEWDPVSEEVRRPIQLDGGDAERYGLEVPLTAAIVESQSIAYQKLYRKLSRLETLPNFSVQAIRANVNFSGFIIGETVEPL
jgi:hypothetical protein